METQSKNSTAALMNLSTLTQYFIPFGNLIFPIIIWSTNKDKSEYIDQQGKQTIVGCDKVVPSVFQPQKALFRAGQIIDSNQMDAAFGEISPGIAQNKSGLNDVVIVDVV